MEPQVYNWTCSVCSLTWAVNALGNTDFTRENAGQLLGYPGCVNPTYGLTDIYCMVDAFVSLGYKANTRYLTFDEAYAICALTTGVINPVGMYHFMGIRGVRNGNIWVANSAQGYRGIYDDISRTSYNNLGPTQLVFLLP